MYINIGFYQFQHEGTVGPGRYCSPYKLLDPRPTTCSDYSQEWPDKHSALIHPLRILQNYNATYLQNT